MFLIFILVIEIKGIKIMLSDPYRRDMKEKPVDP
jgi:hypothetical protein